MIGKLKKGASFGGCIRYVIGKLKKGASFGGCVRYVTGKDEAKILASDGVLLGTNTEINRKSTRLNSSH